MITKSNKFCNFNGNSLERSRYEVACDGDCENCNCLEIRDPNEEINYTFWINNQPIASLNADIQQDGRFVAGSSGIENLNLFVEEQRSKGYGTQFLIEVFEDLFKYSFIDSIWLGTSVNNTRAQHIYNKIGMKIDDSSDNYMLRYCITKEEFADAR